MTNLKALVFKLREYLNEGGEGSGNFGHAGRPGEVGGSAPEGEGGASASSDRVKDEYWGEGAEGKFEDEDEVDYERGQSVRCEDFDAKPFANIILKYCEDKVAGKENSPYKKFLDDNFFIYGSDTRPRRENASNRHPSVAYFVASTIPGDERYVIDIYDSGGKKTYDIYRDRNAARESPGSKSRGEDLYGKISSKL